MSDAYAAAGVDTDQADAGVGALVAVLKTIETGSPSRSVVPSGHYASVLKVSDDLGIAIATDGVGSKLVVAEEADRLETVGIDCVAMNVNDLICVGAEPIALVDYLAVEQVDAGRLARIGQGLKVGAEAAGTEVPGGELAVLPELIRGHPSPHGFDLCATAIGTVRLDDLVLGDRIAPGDALIGVPSSGLHSNGYTLARRALQVDGGLTLDDTPEELGGASVADALLEPTVIYVRAVLELLKSSVDVRGLAHITGGGLNNILRLGRGYEISDPLPSPPVFDLVARLGDVPVAEMWEVFNMGCGFIAIVPEADADEAARILASHHEGARRIGTVTDRDGTVTVPGLGLTFPLR
ncbi:phosphoribosylformylglycinamidine cyclo-ligase [Conexibacter woesei]|uniref:phosphoribosylformylglycinamidine cyclo-ligase n=1 Tax=Conexibacter woesei TaxID=191495 RepID=UPI00041D5F2C|nr:phosphoribosylformylglycinamidine cyclo-ligase [Conexibacter woesei]